MDLVDQANLSQAKESAKAILDESTPDVAMSVCRDFVIEQISMQVKKFPVSVQREIIALLTDSFLTEWSSDGQQE